MSCDFYSSCGASTLLNDQYSYDQHGNVAAIADHRASHATDRVMSYDGLDRLKTVASTMFGNASYSYNTLDDLTG